MYLENLKSKWDSEIKFRIPNFLTNIIFVWAMVFFGMVVYVFFWFIMGLPLITFIVAIRDNITFVDPLAETVVDFCLNCFLVHPIISLAGWFIWGILNSAKRDVDQWRTA